MPRKKSVEDMKRAGERIWRDRDGLCLKCGIGQAAQARPRRSCQEVLRPVPGAGA